MNAEARNKSDVQIFLLPAIPVSQISQLFFFFLEIMSGTLLTVLGAYPLCVYLILTHIK